MATSRYERENVEAVNRKQQGQTIELLTFEQLIVNKIKNKKFSANNVPVSDKFVDDIVKNIEENIGSSVNKKLKELELF